MTDLKATPQVIRQHNHSGLSGTDAWVHSAIEVFREAVHADKLVREKDIESDERLIGKELDQTHEREKLALLHEHEREVEERRTQRQAMWLSSLFVFFLLVIVLVSMLLDKEQMAILIVTHLIVGVGAWSFGERRGERRGETRGERRVERLLRRERTEAVD
ncbi:MAG TPA: hypothetical protein VIK91_16690 [Nannocystis sp.]